MNRGIVKALPILLAAAGYSESAHAARSLDDYRHFRALSIDLVGRIPTRAEIAAFEEDSFDVGAWVDQQLKGPGYVDRIRGIYQDLLRLQVSDVFLFRPQPSRLRRITLIGPDGSNIYVYYRPGQRRATQAIDGDFCLTPDQTGYRPGPGGIFQPCDGQACAPPHPVQQADLDAVTVMVKPWWLYLDYASASPSQLYPSWAATYPQFTPIATLLVEPDQKTPTAQIRVCKEEAQTADTGTFFAPGNPPKTYPNGRLVPLPTDNGYAVKHKGEPVSCTVTLSGAVPAADCGCGVGLERCLPGDNPGIDPRSFNFTQNEPIGLDEPTDAVDQAGSRWHKVWWAEEASRFFGYVLSQDRDFREVLTGRYTLVNGPLAQFYRFAAPNTCCGPAMSLGYAQPQPLLDPAQLPSAQSLPPQDTSDWQLVADRGPAASGILTMPVFLTKFGTRRARAHVLYNAFKCKDFIAGNIQLKPSTEPNLMIRAGCSTCHAILEPMAAYFSRVVENDWTYLPASVFPVLDPTCKQQNAMGTINGACANYYDPAFTNMMAGTLRGAYPDTYSNGQYGPPVTHHADEGPAGLANALIGDPDFAPCVAQNVAQALLGRPLTGDDAGFQQSLTTAFVSGGYKMSALVKAVVMSSHYYGANNFTPTEWRKEDGP